MALGAVLLQEYDDNWHPVVYASWKLTPAEKNYTIMERETLAVIFALKTWRLYLFKHFDVFTDNRSVVYLQSKPHLSKREIRWTEFLADFHSCLDPSHSRERELCGFVDKTGRDYHRS